MYIVGFAIVSAFLIALLKRLEPNLAAALSIASCVMLLLGIGDMLSGIVDSIRGLSQNTQLDSAYFNILIRIVGIAYIAQIGAQTCREAGADAVAQNVELCAKVLILSISTPIFLSLIEMITGVLA